MIMTTNTNDYQPNEQLLTHLLEYDIPERMISIVTKQRISDLDLKLIDRDDVDHLFKNEYGFTFGERKRFWNAIQKLQSAQTFETKDEPIIDSSEMLEHIYEFADEEIEKTESQDPPLAPASPQSDRPLDIINLIDNVKSDEQDDHHSNSSSHLSEFSFSSDYVFTYPSILPNFSANITHALQTNTIHKQWAAFINELARWVMSIKPCLREQHEYRAIGQTLYEKYPSIGTAGPKPWSFLCRSLSQRIRTERWQRRKTLATNKRKETHRRKLDRPIRNLQTEMLL